MRLKARIVLISSIIIILTISAQGIVNTLTSNDSIETVVELQLKDQLTNLESSITSANEVLAITRSALDEKNIALAKSVAQLITDNPTWLEPAKMIELAKFLSVSEIHVTDGNGVLRFGNIEGFYGFDFNTTDQTRPFIPLISSKTGAIAQAPSPRGTDNVLFQYISVSRLDEPGIVQVGIEPTAVQELLNNLDVQKSIERLVIGDGGYAAIIGADGMILNHKDVALIGTSASDIPWLAEAMTKDNTLEKFTQNGETFYEISRKFGDITLVVTYPLTQINAIFRTSIINNIAAIVISVIALVVIIQWIIGRWVSKPIQKIQSGMAEVGKGNFTVHIDYHSKDEIGALSKDFEKMTENVKHLIFETASSIDSVATSSEKIHENVEGLTATTHEVSKAIGEIASGANEMASNVSERLGTGQQLGQSVNAIFHKLMDAKTESDQMVSTNDEGRRTIELLKEVFKRTVENTHLVADNVDALSESSQEIENIVVTIKGIADQTNLLALNASIEAARAGETGRGFAVVADEIRKLAELSAKSAGEINDIIRHIVAVVSSTTHTVTETKDSVVRAEVNLNETVMVFDEIGSSVGRVGSIIDAFIFEIKVIEKMKNELIASLESMAAISQQSAASTEEINASTEEQLSRVTEIGEAILRLNEDIVKLSDEMQKFTV
mgnify:CR=1 FL=1